MDVLPDLFCEEISELIANLVLLIKFMGKLEWIVAFADKDVFISPLSYFDRQSQNLFCRSFWGSCRRTFVVLPLMLLLIDNSLAFEIVVL